MIVLLSLPLGWIGIVAERTRQQKKVLEHFEEYTTAVRWRHGHVVTVGLEGTHVTDVELGHLKGLTHLTVLDFYDTQVTNAGVVHLKRLTKLKWLGLFGTQVTEEGIKELEEALPECKISWSPPPTPKTNLDQN